MKIFLEIFALESSPIVAPILYGHP